MENKEKIKIVKTKYGNLDKETLDLYNSQLKSRTFALLYLFEEQPFETYQRALQDLLQGVLSFEKIKLEENLDRVKFAKYIELVVSCLEPYPLNETKHSFIRRHILDAVNLLDKMFKEAKVAYE